VLVLVVLAVLNQDLFHLVLQDQTALIQYSVQSHQLAVVMALEAVLLQVAMADQEVLVEVLEQTIVQKVMVIHHL
tara:strand:- start:138 stop:362 length:225 start_codon:yes stop_codon:yes gene_type:complete